MDPATSTGFWELTIIMVVIASWLLYRYVAPKGWREWSRAGLVQASWGHESGHLWAALFGWGDLGAMVEMLVGYALVFFGISVLIEGWREVYHANREGCLANDRLYGMVRHPQYTGIFLAVFGQLIHWPTIPTLVLFPVIIWAYYRLANREETQMIEQFGEEYLAYRRRVPMFFPRRGEWRQFLDEARYTAQKLGPTGKPGTEGP
jgi:protein-S-isoprenylcysteine O-methyltransferase Ste14